MAVTVAQQHSSRAVQRRSQGDVLQRHALTDPLQRQVSIPQSGGAPLPDAVQRQMSGALGQDFSGVRVHEGAHATQLGAVAFTQGENVHFAPGAYNPGTTAGQRLIGHELAHVTQQRAGAVTANGDVSGVPLNDSPHLESAADQAGDRAVQRMEKEEEKPAQPMTRDRADEAGLGVI